MFTKLQRWALALVVGVAWLVAGCVSSGLPRGADYRHRYFAGLADYNQAKRTALAYVRIPDTPRENAVEIVEIVREADEKIREFEEVRRAIEAPGADDYARVITAVEIAVSKLRDYIGGNQ